MLLRRLVRRAEGGVRVTLPTAERKVLLDLATALRQRIADVDPDTPLDEITGRLFPAAYDDPLDEMEYAATAMQALAEGKRTMLDTFVESLHAGETRGGRWRADLDDEQTTAWLTVLQDGRLTLSRLLRIETEEDWEALRGDDSDLVMILEYLGHLLHHLVRLLSGALPEPG